MEVCKISTPLPSLPLSAGPTAHILSELERLRKTVKHRPENNSADQLLSRTYT